MSSESDASVLSRSIDQPDCFACGGGQGLGSAQSLIRAGARITRDVEVPRDCAGTYHGTVLYRPSLGPAGQAGGVFPRLRAPGAFLVGRFSIVVP